MEWHKIKTKWHEYTIKYGYLYGEEDKVWYSVDGRADRTAQIYLCKWAIGLHGNAPSGTQYGWFVAIMPYGKRVHIPLYV